MSAGHEPVAGERLLATYDLVCEHEQDAFARAREIAFEQTVELPEACVPPALVRAVVGHVDDMVRLGKRRWRATLSYPAEIVGGEVPQLLNLLFGNVSLFTGVRLVDLVWPPSLLAAFGGPRFGIAGVRKLLPQADGRALLMVPIKPIGLTARELGALAHRFARGGVDLIKDDNSLADQATAPFAERVARVAELVRLAHEETGSQTIYIPHVSGPLERLAEKVAILRREGVRAALVSAFTQGLDALRYLAQSSGLLLFTHPALSGALFGKTHGMAPEVVYGDLLRVLGADGVVYANAGGRFPVDEAQCEATNERLRRPLDGIAPAFPVAGGGVRVETLPRWAARYGADTVFLIGGSL